MLVEGNTRMWVAQQLGEPGLAQFDRQSAQVLAIAFEQVKGAEHGRERRGPAPEQRKDRSLATLWGMACPCDRSAVILKALPLCRANKQPIISGEGDVETN